ncbi:MAG TPA: hypothetical protein VMT95_05090 [Candidatus Binatia bacterium]|nr:hypothetical protein [Candidatus Binatia bacterium]
MPPWRAVVQSYYAITGGRDDGAYCLDVLKHWRVAGIGGDRIAAFARRALGRDLQRLGHR